MRMKIQKIWQPAMILISVLAMTTDALAERTSPVVVELFTSQGCNSCPPAEAYLNILADRENVIALEYHVDYWDYIGWKDPFAKSSFSARQKAYVEPLDMRYVYTPQMVIDGSEHEVGSREMSVEVAIDQALNLPYENYPRLVIDHGVDHLGITITANGFSSTEEYDVVVVSFDAHHETKITRGENRGKTLISSNIVRDIKILEHWDGGNFSAKVAIDSLIGDGGCAVLLQRKGGGEILAAALYSLG